MCGLNLHPGRVRSGIGKSFFTERVIRPRNGPPREAAESLSVGSLREDWVWHSVPWPGSLGYVRSQFGLGISKVSSNVMDSVSLNCSEMREHSFGASCKYSSCISWPLCHWKMVVSLSANQAYGKITTINNATLLH